MKSSLETIEKATKHSRCCKNKQMTTYKLADALNVSLSTIRRDLNVLETKNDIIRKYGIVFTTTKIRKTLINQDRSY